MAYPAAMWERAALWIIVLVSGFLATFFSVGGEGGTLPLTLALWALCVVSGITLYWHYRFHGLR